MHPRPKLKRPTPGDTEGFRDLGYFDRQNIVLEHRFAAQTPQRFRSMAAELVALNVDVLVTVGPQTAPYARAATTTVPVVFMGVPNPVGSGFVDSLARPGRNMTPAVKSEPTSSPSDYNFCRTCDRACPELPCWSIQTIQ